MLRYQALAAVARRAESTEGAPRVTKAIDYALRFSACSCHQHAVIATATRMLMIAPPHLNVRTAMQVAKQYLPSISFASRLPINEQDGTTAVLD